MHDYTQINAIELTPLGRARAACLVQIANEFGQVYRLSGSGSWLPDGNLTPEQLKRALKRQLRTRHSMGPPIFHSPGHRALDAVLAELVRLLWDKAMTSGATQMSGIGSRIALLVWWLFDAVAHQNLTPEQTLNCYRRSILDIMIPANSYDEVLEMANTNEILERLHADVLAEKSNPSKKVSKSAAKKPSAT